MGMAVVATGNSSAMEVFVSLRDFTRLKFGASIVLASITNSPC